ncbi:histidine kinase dimerization/phosphoacceptor domain -containing protein [Bradyrhizobium sp. CB1650]|uniref:sensor histidine kinase n=1 Tax=Bradyrhizobium sp. CB1650 TaxID=3039153 RepID=UPI00243520EE|nr:histidine kinase dimerization/phosphoacceptor domain -containing protein [Bradyrhizobium sp. CB1650]WGD55589.1 histidine kinase dimerization/phosphoacceptor domain -containing protein [Bradyrhizobium sp. CB1650]
MESLLLRLIAVTPRYPVSVRYVLTLGLVGITFTAKLLLFDVLDSYPLLLFIPAVFLASVIFDHGSGVLATMASAIMAAAYFMPPPATSAIVPLIVFLGTGLLIAGVTETLRKTLDKLSQAKSHSDVLLQELAHRTRNDLATIISLLRLQARSDSNPAVQAAIASAVARVDVVAKVHDRLRVANSDLVDLAPYVERLCGSLADFHRGVRPIAIEVHCDSISVRSSQAGSVGLIVNELVTNAFKYAFPEGQAGVVVVDIRANDRQVVIMVRDDGIGCPSELKSGLGTRLINLLTAQMNGSMTRNRLPRGCEVRVVVSVDG